MTRPPAVAGGGGEEERGDRIASHSYPGQRQQAGARRALVCALRSHAKAGLGTKVLAGRPPHFF